MLAAIEVNLNQRISGCFTRFAEFFVDLNKILIVW